MSASFPGRIIRIYPGAVEATSDLDDKARPWLRQGSGMNTFDVCIIGGGVMGVSTAYWLTELAPDLAVAVIERDPSHEFSSTALSVASIRQQFTLPINVRISRFGLQFIHDFRMLTQEVGGIDLCFRGNGYLFLAGAERGADILRTSCAMQNAEGARTELIGPEELPKRFPWLDPHGVAMASFGGDDEGWFDNMGLLAGLRSLARARGVTFIHGEVVAFNHQAGTVRGLELGNGRQLSCGTVVNAAGTRASTIMNLLGEKYPVEPRKRTVFVVDAPGARIPEAPLLVDYQGFYARPEGTHWITAMVPETDVAVDPSDFEPDWLDFEDTIWTKLAARIPGFDRAKVLRCWVGHYAYNTFDQNAIVGRHPNWSNLLLVNGFSGHGLQQAPAMGRGVAELVVFGAFRALDLSSLGPERVAVGHPQREMAIV